MLKSLFNYNKGPSEGYLNADSLSERRCIVTNYENSHIVDPLHIFPEKFWSDYRNYLLMLGQSQHTIVHRLRYAKKYGYVLLSGDAQIIWGLTYDVKQHVMKSLSSLSKYLGLYEKWLLIIKQYQLKWRKPNETLDFFNTLVNSTDKLFPSMIDWIRFTCNSLPREYANIVLFTALTGLRPDEALRSLEFIKKQPTEYIDYKRMLLQHYKYPRIFLHRTKNAFVSVINENILTIALDTPACITYDDMFRQLHKRNLRMKLSFCRKVFATFLRDEGIQPEIIDVLQGRTPQSIFVKHYYRPNINYDEIRDKLAKLDKLITT